MKITLGIGQNNFMNINRSNQSTAAQNMSRSSGQLSMAGRKDSVTITPQGKKNMLLEELMKQKTSISEQKNALIGSTLEQGGTLDDIKLQLETYDEQLKNIDSQIADMMSAEMDKQTEKPEKKDVDKPNTKEEIQNERLATITDLSSDLQQSKVMNSVKTEVDGNIRVLKSEIEMDKMGSGSWSGAKVIASKKAEALADMEKRSSDLTSQISDKLSDVVEKSNDINKPQEIAPDDTESKTEESTSADKPSIGADIAF